MRPKVVVIDGNNGPHKSAIADSIKQQLLNQEVRVSLHEQVNLLDLLLALEHHDLGVELPKDSVKLLQSDHILALVRHFYSNNPPISYASLNKAMEIIESKLNPCLTVIIDSPHDGYNEDIRRGYLWEGHQRNFYIVRDEKDVPTVINHLLEILKPKSKSKSRRKNSSSHPTDIASILSKKVIPKKPTSRVKQPSITHKNRSGRKRHKSSRAR